MYRIAIVGGSGYIGGELLRLLLGHPSVQVVAVTANEKVGRPISEVHPNLRGFTDQPFVGLDALPTDCSLYFLALPTGESAGVVERLPKEAKVVDTAGDHRHKPGWVYGIPEIHRGRIKEGTRVAAAGCFATAAILSLHPLAEAGWIEGPVFVDGKTGSSGSGNKPGEKTHHPVRAGSLFGYDPFTHRHTPEISQALGGVDVVFQPHSTPLVRGVFTTSFVQLKGSDAVEGVIRKAYEGERFVRLAPGSPNVNFVEGSNFVDIGWAQQGRRAILFAAIDNLVKGGAGQAVQCMNLMLGLDEGQGLATPPLNP